MESLPGGVISSMPGPPPRQHKHERQYTASTHPFILTRRIWKDDYYGQMIFGDLVDLKLLGICLRPGADQSSKAAFCKSAFAKKKLLLVKVLLLEADLRLDRASLFRRKQWSGQVQRAKCFLLKRAKTCSKAFLLFARLTKESTF